MQLCAVDVRINCWARISVGEAGLGVAWLGWRAAESALPCPVLWEATPGKGVRGQLCVFWESGSL